MAAFKKWKNLPGNCGWWNQKRNKQHNYHLQY